MLNFSIKIIFFSSQYTKAFFLYKYGIFFNAPKWVCIPKKSQSSIYLKKNIYIIKIILAYELMLPGGGAWGVILDPVLSANIIAKQSEIPDL